MARFGKYRIKKAVNCQGSSVTVFQAEDPEGTGVLLRILQERVDPESDEFQRFSQEFETLRGLCHPGILPVLDWGIEDGKAYYAAPVRPTLRPLSEYLSGGAVEFEAADAVEIGRQVLDALEHVHSHQILHRDIRPTSVYYDIDSGETVLAEFNLVRNFNLPSLTLQGVQAMALPLVTPESVRNLPVSVRTDLYLVGNLIYEVLAGSSGIRLDFTYEPLAPAGRGVTVALDAALARALAEDPEARYESCAEFRQTLLAVR